MTLKSDIKLKNNWLVLSKTQKTIHRLKNSDPILENKMAELNRNKNSRQPDFILPWK